MICKRERENKRIKKREKLEGGQENCGVSNLVREGEL